MSRAIEILDTKDDIAIVRDDIRSLGHDLCRDIRNAKNDLIRWMFIFWIAQVEATFLMFLFLVKK
ncbi:MAG TPA: hypothetical protein VK671_16085 [Mucilaginibacter sp.]|nr:hypothetical protein [Mucilaginibacter sp.]